MKENSTSNSNLHLFACVGFFGLHEILHPNAKFFLGFPLGPGGNREGTYLGCSFHLWLWFSWKFLTVDILLNSNILLHHVCSNFVSSIYLISLFLIDNMIKNYIYTLNVHSLSSLYMPNVPCLAKDNCPKWYRKSQVKS